MYKLLSLVALAAALSPLQSLFASELNMLQTSTHASSKDSDDGDTSKDYSAEDVPRYKTLEEDDYSYLEYMYAYSSLNSDSIISGHVDYDELTYESFLQVHSPKEV
mmetsp:Transcript_29275/g.52373  ORF Transcript_29275/g.52373 Transcript_29275/m.52373 type:complete len:106 (-) Transcript_29275:292-609(-)